MEDEKFRDPNHVFCIIVGGGMGGVTMGAHLIKMKSLEYSEFRIIDQNADYGGVWYANKYPGAACDVPSHAYTMRYFLKPDWSKKYAPQNEIQGYYAQIANYYKLKQSTTFNTKVIEARWNADTLLWEVTCENKITGERSLWTANSLVHSGGQFSRPKYANIPGKDSFKGEVIHTAMWDESIDLTGKRVAIIGTGPSTGQVAPKIAPLVKKLYIYQRSATYVVPRGDGPLPWWKVSLFKWLPPVLWLYHIWWYLSIEFNRKMWFYGTPEHTAAQNYSLDFLKSQVHDPIVQKKLTPSIPFACKRLLVLDDYYPIFNRENVELITDKPVRITEKGIVSKPPHELPKEELEGLPVGSYDVAKEEPNAHEQEREIDVLIWGTGFEMTDQGGHFQVHGVDGINLSQTWGDTPKAYYSVGVSKFPNFMLILGPNAANFWAVIPTLVEIQTKYNCKVIAHLKKENQKAPYALYVDEKVQAEYNAGMQRELTKDPETPIAILSPKCANYYTNSKGEATFFSPFDGFYLRWKLFSPSWKDYVVLRKNIVPLGVDGNHATNLETTQKVLPNGTEKVVLPNGVEQPA